MKLRLVIASVSLILVAAFLIPTLLPDGTRTFSGERRAMAAYALRQVESFGLEGLQGAPVISTVVESVDQLTGSQPCDYVLGNSETTLRLSTDYRATVRLRTIFGLTYGRMEVTCRTLSWL